MLESDLAGRTLQVYLDPPVPVRAAHPFSGPRIACGLAQGLALGAGLRLVGIGTLAALAEAARRRHAAARVLAALDARMHEVYVAAYECEGERWRERMSPMVVKPDLVPVPPSRGWFAAGSGFSAYPSLRSRVGSAVAAFDADIAPSAAVIGALALPRLAAGGGVSPRDAAPLYVRHRVAMTTAERAAGAVL